LTRSCADFNLATVAASEDPESPRSLSGQPSAWLADAPVGELRPPLDADTGADVCIIGAGMTGLSSALALRAEGLDVVLLDAEMAGFGASGRNAGHVTPTVGKDLPTLARMYGAERVAALVELQETSISHVERLIAEHRIECNYEPVGNVIAAVHPRQHRNLDVAAETAARYGVAGEMLEAHDMERRGLPRAFTRGWFEPHGGILDPARYVAGLRRAALDAGVRLYEHTPVIRIDEGPTAVVVTPRAVVRAGLVVIGTNAYTPSLRRMSSAGMRIQVQLFRTAPLDDRQLAAVGWPGREGVYTAHEILESYRLTADNRIVGGSKLIRSGFGSFHAPDVDASTSRGLELLFRRRFPELGDVDVTDHWGGPIMMSLDFLPVIGRGGEHDNIIHSIAYAGHGVPLASYAGEMVADLIAGRDGPGKALWARRSIPVPPEPLRWLAFRGLTRLFEWMDARVDRSAPRRQV